MGAGGVRQRVFLHGRADVDVGDREPQRNPESAGSIADDDRPAIRRGIHVGAAIRFSCSEGLRRKACAGALGGRTTVDAGRTRVYYIYQYVCTGCGDDGAKLLYQRSWTGGRVVERV